METTGIYTIRYSRSISGSAMPFLSSRPFRYWCCTINCERIERFPTTMLFLMRMAADLIILLSFVEGNQSGIVAIKWKWMWLATTYDMQSILEGDFGIILKDSGLKGELTGTVFRFFPDFAELVLSNNILQGRILAEIATLRYMQRIHSLMGPCQKNIAIFCKLKLWIWLRIILTGTVPALHVGANLNLSQNGFNGTAPDTLCSIVEVSLPDCCTCGAQRHLKMNNRRNVLI